MPTRKVVDSEQEEEKEEPNPRPTAETSAKDDAGSGDEASMSASKEEQRGAAADDEKEQATTLGTTGEQTDGTAAHDARSEEVKASTAASKEPPQVGDAAPEDEDKKRAAESSSSSSRENDPAATAAGASQASSAEKGKKEDKRGGGAGGSSGVKDPSSSSTGTSKPMRGRGGRGGRGRGRGGVAAGRGRGQWSPAMTFPPGFNPYLHPIPMMQQQTWPVHLPQPANWHIHPQHPAYPGLNALHYLTQPHMANKETKQQQKQRMVIENAKEKEEEEKSMPPLKKALRHIAPGKVKVYSKATGRINEAWMPIAAMERGLLWLTDDEDGESDDGGEDDGGFDNDERNDVRGGGGEDKNDGSGDPGGKEDETCPRRQLQREQRKRRRRKPLSRPRVTDTVNNLHVMLAVLCNGDRRSAAAVISRLARSAGLLVDDTLNTRREFESLLLPPLGAVRGYTMRGENEGGSGSGWAAAAAPVWSRPKTLEQRVVAGVRGFLCHHHSKGQRKTNVQNAIDAVAVACCWDLCDSVGYDDAIDENGGGKETAGATTATAGEGSSEQQQKTAAGGTAAAAAAVQTRKRQRPDPNEEEWSTQDIVRILGRAISKPTMRKALRRARELKTADGDGRFYRPAQKKTRADSGYTKEEWKAVKAKEEEERKRKLQEQIAYLERSAAKTRDGTFSQQLVSLKNRVETANRAQRMAQVELEKLKSSLGNPLSYQKSQDIANMLQKEFDGLRREKQAVAYSFEALDHGSKSPKPTRRWAAGTDDETLRQQIDTLQERVEIANRTQKEAQLEFERLKATPSENQSDSTEAEKLADRLQKELEELRREKQAMVTNLKSLHHQSGSPRPFSPSLADAGEASERGEGDNFLEGEESMM